MNKPYLSILALLFLVSGVMPAAAKPNTHLRAPAPGVLCDRFICVNDKGLSRTLTLKYLGKHAAAGKAFTITSDVDTTAFTFANGVFCDVKARLCRLNRYYGPDGKPSGAISRKYTKQLFGTVDRK